MTVETVHPVYQWYVLGDKQSKWEKIILVLVVSLLIRLLAETFVVNFHLFFFSLQTSIISISYNWLYFPDFFFFFLASKLVSIR